MEEGKTCEKCGMALDENNTSATNPSVCTGCEGEGEIAGGEETPEDTGGEAGGEETGKEEETAE